MQDSFTTRVASATPTPDAPSSSALLFRSIADLVAEVEARERDDETRSPATDAPLRLFEP